MLLSTLALDSLDRILHFAGDNDVLRLILTGNPVLSNKIKRCGSLSVSWESCAYFNFNACLPLIRAFSNLKSLRLTTWSPHLLALKRLDQAHFPSTLTSLELDFNDALGILQSVHGRTIFQGLPLLESLSISSGMGPRRQSPISLRDFHSLFDFCGSPRPNSAPSLTPIKK